MDYRIQVDGMTNEYALWHTTSHLGLELWEFFVSRYRVQFRDDIMISLPVVRPLVLSARP